MKRIFSLVIEAIVAAQQRRARARLLAQLDERTLRDIGLEHEANRARARSRHAFHALRDVLAMELPMEYLVQGNLPLVRGSLVRIEDGRDMLVYVWNGSVWITQEGDRRDRYVAAGGWFRITRAGLTLVSALDRSAISLTSPHEQGFAERIDLVRAGTGNVDDAVCRTGQAERAGLRAGRRQHLERDRFAPQARPTTAAL